MSQDKKKKKDGEKVQICGRHHINTADCEGIQNSLLSWYDTERRILPWREIAKTETDDDVRGYAVWVSEVMLQQTQVVTVIPYFKKWMEAWPTVESLARVELERVYELWSGLGYYSRARRLQEGAKVIVDELGGHVPHLPDELQRRVPGIGPYSAAAIASVAFGQVCGVVDGNVVRVLSRLKVIGAEQGSSGVKDHLWSLANDLVSRKRPGDFNQALMELGATLCTPQNPNCSKCPVKDFCSAFKMSEDSKRNSQNVFEAKSTKHKMKSKKKQNVKLEIADIENAATCSFCLPHEVWRKNPQVTVFPCKVQKKAARRETVKVSVIQREGQLLMTRRPSKGLLAGLWEFPATVLPEGCDQNSTDELVRKNLERLGIDLNGSMSEMRHMGEVVHLFSHIHSTYSVDFVCLKNAAEQNKKNRTEDTRWVDLDEVNTIATSTAMKKILALVKQSSKEKDKPVTSLKRKRSLQDIRQASIKSYFAKS